MVLLLLHLCGDVSIMRCEVGDHGDKAYVFSCFFLTKDKSPSLNNAVILLFGLGLVWRGNRGKEEQAASLTSFNLLPQAHCVAPSLFAAFAHTGRPAADDVDQLHLYYGCGEVWCGVLRGSLMAMSHA